MEHSINETHLLQTFVGFIDGKPAAMYQLSMCDDLCSHPDIYPWIINVYLDEKFRERGVCGYMMETVKENAKKAGLNELFLYTNHIGLYEKFGWVYVEDVYRFNEKSPVGRLYSLKIK